MDYLTLGFLAFGLVVLIGFVIVLTDKGLKWKKNRSFQLCASAPLNLFF